jgi:hypothetical protein
MDDQRTNGASGGVRRTLRLAILMISGACVGGIFSPTLAGSSWVFEKYATEQLTWVVSAAFVGLAVEFFLRFREATKINGIRYGTRELMIAITAVAIALGAVVFLNRI